MAVMAKEKEWLIGQLTLIQFEADTYDRCMKLIIK